MPSMTRMKSFLPGLSFSVLTKFKPSVPKGCRATPLASFLRLRQIQNIGLESAGMELRGSPRS